MATVKREDIRDYDQLGNRILPYRIAKELGIRKGDIFATDDGCSLQAFAYIDWNPRTHRRCSGFACVWQD